jgi:hypothetical protein
VYPFKESGRNVYRVEKPSSINLALLKNHPAMFQDEPCCGAGLFGPLCGHFHGRLEEI